MNREIGEGWSGKQALGHLSGVTCEELRRLAFTIMRATPNEERLEFSSMN
jgi:hypothetical protein